MPAAVAALPDRPNNGADYGLDDPGVVRRWFGRAGWLFAIGLFVWFINHEEYAAPSLRILVVFSALAVLCCAVAGLKIRASRVGKFALRDRLLDSLALQGDEKILDVGCGRGLMSIAAAKRLKTGKVTGIDNWDAEAISGNSIESAKENAKSEGVADRVRFDASPFQTGSTEGAPARKLVYPEGNFDVVLSFRFLHTLAGDMEREKALSEMVRVLKPGGRLLIFDSLDTGHYAKVLDGWGVQNVTFTPWTFLWLTPERAVSGQK